MASKTFNGKDYEWDESSGDYVADDGETLKEAETVAAAGDPSANEQTKTVDGEVFRLRADGKWESLTSDKVYTDDQMTDLEANAQNSVDYETASNQTQAETDRVSRAGGADNQTGGVSPDSKVGASAPAPSWWSSLSGAEKKMIGAGGGIGLLLLDKLLGGGLTESKRTPTGFTGNIDLSQRAQRLAVPGTTDANRMPGSGGLSYFTPTAVSTQANAAGDLAALQAEAAKRAAANAALTPKLAGGGIAAAADPRYLRGDTDGMADEIPATIDGNQPARLAHGEFVVPADVVSHLGNGNSDAGAKKLHEMMDNVRQARTGTTEQGREIDPNKFIATATGDIADLTRPAVPQGPQTMSFGDGGTVQDAPLNTYFGPYINTMMTQANALAEAPYQAYQGPLTAGTSALQDQAFLGASSLNLPQNMGTSGFQPTSFTQQGVAQQYMNPYIQNALNPQLEEMRRQSDITQMQNNAKMVGAGAYGGSRQALMNTETQRNLLDKMAGAIGQGYSTAFDKAQGQFNTEQNRQQQAQQDINRYGIDVLNLRDKLGAEQRDIAQQGITADKAAFEEERANPYKMLQFKQAMLSGMPVSNTQASQYQPSLLTQLAGAGLGGLTLAQILGQTA